MEFATKTHLRVKRTKQVHEIKLVREPRYEGDVPAYQLLSEDRQRVTWYWKHEVEAE